MTDLLTFGDTFRGVSKWTTNNTFLRHNYRKGFSKIVLCFLVSLFLEHIKLIIKAVI